MKLKKLQKRRLNLDTKKLKIKIPVENIWKIFDETRKLEFRKGIERLDLKMMIGKNQRIF